MSKKGVKEMMHVIEEGCEKIDEDGWKKLFN